MKNELKIKPNMQYVNLETNEEMVGEISFDKTVLDSAVYSLCSMFSEYVKSGNNLENLEKIILPKDSSISIGKCWTYENLCDIVCPEKRGKENE